MKKLVDFIIEITKNPKKGKAIIELLKKNPTPDVLQKWFTGKGYKISKAECKTILKHKEDLVRKGLEPLGYS